MTKWDAVAEGPAEKAATASNVGWLQEREVPPSDWGELLRGVGPQGVMALVMWPDAAMAAGLDPGFLPQWFQGGLLIPAPGAKPAVRRRGVTSAVSHRDRSMTVRWWVTRARSYLSQFGGDEEAAAWACAAQVPAADAARAWREDRSVVEQWRTTVQVERALR